MSRDYWKIEEDLCRCCHSEGTFKNLAGAYNFGEEEEIYFNMLRDTLDINITPATGSLCAPTYTICEPCILRLRDATSFKKQVIDCELKFKNMYGSNFIKIAQQDYVVEIKDEVPEEDSKYAEEPQLMPEVEHDNSFDNKLDDVDHDDFEEEFSTEQIKPEGKKKAKKAPQKTKPKAKPKKPPKKSGRTRKVKEIKEEEKQGVEEKTEDGSIRPVTSKLEQLLTEGRADRRHEYYTLQEVEGTKEYSCNTCQRVFKNVPCIKQHYQHVHLKLRPKVRACHLCEVKVPGYLRAAHLEKAHAIPAPTCGACGKKFSYPNQVLRHQKNFHMGEKSFKCKSCDMRFASQANLTQHAIKHSAQREHKCEYCAKAFKWRKNLTTHIMMHLDERRHVCPACNEGFVQQTSLKYHITKKHPEMV